MPNLWMLALDGENHCAQIRRLGDAPEPDKNERSQANEQRKQPLNRRCPTGERADQQQQNRERDGDEPADGQLAPKSGSSKRKLQCGNLILQTRFHQLAASDVLTRRASQPPRTISVNVIASAPARSQRQSFCRFSNSDWASCC